MRGFSFLLPENQERFKFWLSKRRKIDGLGVTEVIDIPEDLRGDPMLAGIHPSEARVGVDSGKTEGLRSGFPSRY